MVKLKLYFAASATWTEHEIRSEYRITEVLHSRLKYTESTARVIVEPDVALYNALRQAGSEQIPAQLLDGTTPIFTGFVRKDFTAMKTQRLGPMALELTTPGHLLRKKLRADFIRTGVSVQAIMTDLIALAGVTGTAFVESEIIDVFSERAGDRTLLDIMCDLAIEYRRGLRFDAAGGLQFFEVFAFDRTPTAVLDGSNLRDVVIQEKREEEVEKVIVIYPGHETLSNQILFSDTTGGHDGLKCDILLPAGQYLTPTQDEPAWYAQFAYDGLVHASGITVDMSAEAGVVVETFTPAPTVQALLKIRNQSAGSRRITKLDIKAASVIRSNGENRAICQTGADEDKVKEIKARYITSKAAAEVYAQGLLNYFSQSDMTYKVQSHELLAIGQVVTLTEAGIGTQVARVVQMERSGIDKRITYRLEAVDTYDPAAVQVVPGYGASNQVTTASDTATQAQDTAQAAEQLAQGAASELATITGPDATTTPEPPVVAAAGGMGQIQLVWSRQATLKNLSHYEAQVSDAGTNWYALGNSLADWKGALNGTTIAPAEGYSACPHSPSRDNRGARGPDAPVSCAGRD